MTQEPKTSENWEIRNYKDFIKSIKWEGWGVKPTKDTKPLKLTKKTFKGLKFKVNVKDGSTKRNN